MNIRDIRLKGEKMAFIKKDVNFGLLFIVILLAIAIASIGVYYNQNYNEISTEYHEQVNSLQKVTQDLLFHKSQLNQTASDLMIKEQDESELNKRYTQLRDEKEKLDKENSQLKTDLTGKTQELVKKTDEILSLKSDLSTEKAAVADLDRKLDIYESKVKALNNKLDAVCGGDTSGCG